MTPILSTDELKNIWSRTKGIAELANEIQKALIKKIKEEGPVAFISYKGYLIHADDPKLVEYSEPTPLYDLEGKGEYD